MQKLLDNVAGGSHIEQNRLAAGTRPPDSAGGATALPGPLAGGEGVAAPRQQHHRTPRMASDCGPRPC